MRYYRILAAFVLAAALAGFAPAARAAVQIAIDKAAQRMTVIVDGELRWSWPVSTGRERYDTPNGRFTPFRMEKDHYSREWDDAPMPHSIFFTRIGHAIHGTDQAQRLGQPASHGCVRLAREHAAMLFALVKEHGVLNTSVVVDGAIPLPPPPPPPAVAGRKPAPAQDYTGTVRRNRMPVEGGIASRAAPEPSQRVTPEPARRVTPQPRAARAYAAPPPAYRAPPTVERRPVYEPRRRYAAPGVSYDPRVEIIEETYVNGHWVRRRYYRQARPQDFYRYR